jgi:hypothetical protein
MSLTTKETAKALQRLLSKIAGEYGDQATAGDKTMPYLCRLAIAPTETLWHPKPAKRALPESALAVGGIGADGQEGLCGRREHPATSYR